MSTIMGRTTRLRWIVALLSLAAWLFTLGVTSAHACQLSMPDESCCNEPAALDVQCSAHCELESEAPAGNAPHVLDVALASPVLLVAAPLLVRPELPPPDTSGAPPLTIRFRPLRI
jgi:hypothetical protein